MTLTEKIEKYLSNISYPTQPEGLYEPISYVLSMGGKRLRPTLLLLSYSLFKDDIDTALPLAIGLETYHNHTLLHDDLMDNADVRRGKPTVHKKWDANTAVLSGDAMLIIAFRHFIEARCAGKEQILKLFANTALEICEGQQYDVNFERRTDVTESEYMEMIRLKTSVLLACAAKAGALAAGASPEDADALYRVAEKMGVAFEVQGAWLDVYGDPKVFGKKIGGDILCGKKTYLLINALNRADAADKQRLLALLADSEMPAGEKIAAVTHIYDALGISQLTLQTIDNLYKEALAALNALALPAERIAPLRQYAGSLLGRKS